MLERLYRASNALNEKMGLHEAMSKAEELAMQGVLEKFLYRGAGEKEEIYYVPEIQYGSETPDNRRRTGVGDNAVFSIKYLADFNKGQGWLPPSFTINRFDEKGGKISWATKAESGQVAETGVQSFFPDGNLQRREVQGTAETEIYEYVEGESWPIYQAIINHRTGKTKINIDRREEFRKGAPQTQ